MLTNGQQPIHIFAFAGSLRASSYNKLLLQEAKRVLPDHTTIDIFDIAPLPMFNSDVEAQGIPDVVLDFRQRMRQADALLISTPEYNYSIPGSLKNALDWASRSRPDGSPLDDKPTAIMGVAGYYGSVRAQLHLREILVHNRNMVVPSPQLTVARGHESFDENGRLASTFYKETLTQLLQNLVALTHKLTPKKEPTL